MLTPCLGDGLAWMVVFAALQKGCWMQNRDVTCVLHEVVGTFGLRSVRIGN